MLITSSLSGLHSTYMPNRYERITGKTNLLDDVPIGKLGSPPVVDFI
jgi:hypothetical protein